MLLLAGCFHAAYGNDGVYYVSGSHLVPLQETDISISKEVLTITLCDDGFASVDVAYEMVNNGPAKTVTMGFEANTPYNDGENFNKSCQHPNIKDFSVVMNGTPLQYKNGVAKEKDDENTAHIPIDLTKWREPVEADPGYEESGADMVHMLFNPATKEYTRYSYVYYFNANFKSGVNTIHHTYRYEMSYGVGHAFEVPYWLTPAMRWANHRIDDFTLRISAENTNKHFLVDGKCFLGSPFKVASGKGKVRKLAKTDYMEEMWEVTLRNGVVEWHARNFTTDDDMCINSADIIYQPAKDCALYYDSGPTYVPFYVSNGNVLSVFGKGLQNEAFAKRIRRNLPYAHRGYVFKDKQLKAIFESQWWYMPDPSFTPTQGTFLPHETKLMEENK